MKASTIIPPSLAKSSVSQPGRRKPLWVRLWPTLLSAGFWLLVWQIASLLLNQDILLVSPAEVLVRLSQLALTPSFWQVVLFSCLRIFLGFLLGIVLGVFMAIAAYLSPLLAQLFKPLIVVVKATPVASFIILALLWIPSKNLSVFMAFLMVLPIIYSNVEAGIQSTDPKLLEMARLFRVPFKRQVSYIYVSQVMPFFRSASVLALGLAWKAGIAAEIIGIPTGSIGEKLYQAKVYLNTPDIFAWTLTVILLSFVLEKLFVLLIDWLVKKGEQR